MKSIMLLGAVLLFPVNSTLAQAPFWQPVNGPLGGLLERVATDSAGHVFAGGFDGTLFISSDNGLNWRSVTIAEPVCGSQPNGMHITALAARRGGVVLAGIGHRPESLCGLNTLYRSTNYGTTWTQVWQRNWWSDVPKALCFNSAGHIFYANYNTILRSTDDGESWSLLGNGLPSDGVSGISVTPHGSLLVGSEAAAVGGLFRSTDNGQSWTRIFGGYVTALASSESNYLLAGIGSGNGSVVARSTDDGITWNVVSSWSSATYALGSHRTTALVGLRDGRIARSTNNGDTWGTVSSEQGQVNNLLFLDSTSAFAATYFKGLLASTNSGASWRRVIANTYLSAIYVQQNGKLYVGTGFEQYGRYGAGSVMVSSDNGTNWSEIILRPEASVLSIGSNDLDHLFVSFYNLFGLGGLFRSTNDGATWIDVGVPDRNLTAALLMKPGGTVLVGTESGLYISRNNGGSWQLAAFSGSRVSAVAANNLGDIFAGGPRLIRSTDNGTTWLETGLGYLTRNIVRKSSGEMFAATDGGLFRSTDNGVSWQRLQNAGQQSIQTPMTVGRSGELFASISYLGKGVTGSIDNGLTWSEISSGLPQPYVMSMATSQTLGVLAGTNGWGLFRTTSSPPSGLRQVVLIHPRGVHPIYNIWFRWYSIHGASSYLWELSRDSTFSGSVTRAEYSDTATYEWGGFQSNVPYYWRVRAKNFAAVGPWSETWSFVVSTTDVFESDSLPPTQYAVYQNYPNPFNPTTTFEFALPKSTHATLRIFDLLGREVITLLDEVLPVGTHKRSWEAREWSSGVYVYRLQAGDFVQTRKLLLLR